MLLFALLLLASGCVVDEAHTSKCYSTVLHTTTSMRGHGCNHLACSNLEGAPAPSLVVLKKRRTVIARDSRRTGRSRDGGNCEKGTRTHGASSLSRDTPTLTLVVGRSHFNFFRPISAGPTNDGKSPAPSSASETGLVRETEGEGGEPMLLNRTQIRLSAGMLLALPRARGQKRAPTAVAIMILGTTSLQTRRASTTLQNENTASCLPKASLTHLHRLAAQSGKGGPKSNRSRPGWR